MALIPVIAAVIHRGGKVLLGRRPHHKRHGGLWEFPGGKVDEGETEYEAVARELMEEFGVETRDAGLVVYECQDPGSQFLVRFLDASIRGQPEAREHSEIGWYEPASLHTVDLAPCDARFVSECLLRTGT
jgi:mutator protein MutT